MYSVCVCLCVTSRRVRGSGSGQRDSPLWEEISRLVPSFAYFSFHLSRPFSLSSPPPPAKAHLSFHSEGEKTFGHMLMWRRGRDYPWLEQRQKSSETFWHVSMTPLWLPIILWFVLLLTYRVWEYLPGNSLTIPVATFHTNTRGLMPLRLAESLTDRGQGQSGHESIT